MFGPLPTIHRWLLGGTVLVACLVAGALVAQSGGLLLGSLVGLLLAFAVVHDVSPAVQPARVRHRR